MAQQHVHPPPTLRAHRTLRPVETEDLPMPAKRNVGPWWHYMTLGMIGMLLLYLFATLIVFPWWTGITNHWEYGKYLIVATNQDVGHETGSLFLSYYTKGNVVVMEMNGKPIHGTIFMRRIELDPTRDAKLSTLHRIAKALKITVLDLYEELPDPNPSE